MEGDTDALRVWGADGQLKFSKTGNYAPAKAFAAAGQILVALGPAGQNSNESIAVPQGLPGLHPAFQGTFQIWFADGGRFLASVSDTVLTYSNTAVQQDATALNGVGGTIPIGNLVGVGTWWANDFNSTLSIYKVGSSATATATYPAGNPIVSGSALAVIRSFSTTISFIDLSGNVPVETDLTTPISRLSAFSAISPTQWLAGTEFGVLYDGASSVSSPRYLDYGQAFGIAGSASRIAVATASGRILIFDAASLGLLETIQKFSGDVQLSADGMVLAAGYDISAAGPQLTTASVIYSLPGASVLSQWGETKLTLSASGTMVGVVLRHQHQQRHDQPGLGRRRYMDRHSRGALALPRRHAGCSR